MTERQIKRLERVFKGIANHWRIKIIFLIAKNHGISLQSIVENLESNYQTTSEHVRRLTIAGLVTKKYHGRTVGHTLSPYGLQAIVILKNFRE